MRTSLLFVLILVGSGLAACKKECRPACGSGYQQATVVHGQNMCDPNGFRIQLSGGGTYPLDSLPTAFQQPGLPVCLKYSLYEDLRRCACCGGTRLRLTDIRRQ
jgi:hypothetical protein